jgi:Ca-activated chloride channel family protein
MEPLSIRATFRRRRPALRVVVLGLALASTGARSQAPADSDTLRLAARRAEALFDSGGERIGELAVSAQLLVASADPERGTVEALISRQSLTGRSPELAVWLVLPRLDGRADVRPFAPGPQDLSEAAAWLFRAEIELADDFLEAAVVVEEIGSGRWGAAIAEFAEPETAREAPRIAVWEAPRPEGPPAGEAPPARAAVVLRLLPVERSPAVGRTRFRTLISDPLVARVDFLLDGEPAGSDDAPPFSAVLDLGPEPRLREVTAVAFTHDGLRLGADTLRVNTAAGGLQVRIERLQPVAGNQLEIAGRVTVPPGAVLASVEVYLDEALVASPPGPEFSLRVDASAAGPSSFARVVARLADGEMQEDARLLSAEAERVEVNLVEVYAVVSGPDGAPAEGLTAADVTLRLGREEVPIERFVPADEAPLRVGLVIDTSGSMEYLMTDTKTAGAQFLADTLRPGDEAFLVDFDTQPRLAHAASGDVISLIRAFGRFRTDGFTALYDAVIFSMLQFEEGTQRRALILLSDGDDYRSKYGQRRCIQYGKDLGVPVYILALGGLLDPRAGLPKVELEGLVEETGGRIFYISDSAELGRAYEAINSELRNQYLLAFATDRELSPKEIESLRVEVSRPRHTVRAVVAGRQLD